MSLKQQLFDDMKEALRAKDRVRLNTIRMLRSQIKNREIERGEELSDYEVLEVLSKAEKARKEAIELYRRGNRQDLVAQEETELAVVRSYMPQPLSEDDLRVLIAEVVAEVGAESMRDMGKVMGAIMPKVRGRADGHIVNRLVKERLQSG